MEETEKREIRKEGSKRAMTGQFHTLVVIGFQSVAGNPEQSPAAGF